MAQPIAVIDDERGVLEMLSDLLQMEGFSVVCCDHPSQVETLKETRPALFLIDIMLPDTDGIELARQLRARSFGNTPMIAMSASGAMVNAAKETGLFRETLKKPFDVVSVLRAVERYMD